MNDVKYVDVEMTKADFIKKYGDQLPIFEDKWVFGKVNPLDDLAYNDIVILRKQK